MTTMVCYAVAIGRERGVYMNWSVSVLIIAISTLASGAVFHHLGKTALHKFSTTTVPSTRSF